MTLTEAPYTEKREKLYAPVAPFAEAIDRWLEHQHRLAGTAVRNRWRPQATGHPCIDGFAGLHQLAELAGTTARNLHRYRRGDARHIELVNADRLALALDIPLCLLAEEFKPMAELHPRKRAAA